MDPPKIQIVWLQAIKLGIGFLVARGMIFWNSLPSRQKAAKPRVKLRGVGDRHMQHHRLQRVEAGSIFPSKGPRRCNFNL